MNKNNISKNRFSRISGVNRRTMIDWFNGNKSISEESYKKIKKAIIKIENDKSNNLEIEWMAYLWIKKNQVLIDKSRKIGKIKWLLYDFN